MKISVLFTLALAVQLLSSCGSNQEFTRVNPMIVNPPQQSLFDIMSTRPGVAIKNNRVTVRGSTACYLVNGVFIDSYTIAAELVRDQEITRLEIISGPRAAVYGLRAGMRIVLIETTISEDKLYSERRGLGVRHKPDARVYADTK